MATYKSGNPALQESAFTGLGRIEEEENRMTLQGTVNKTALLLLGVLVTAVYTWSQFNRTLEFASIAPLFYVGLFGVLVTGLVIVFNKPLSPYLSIVYALLEGLVLGGLSALMESRYPGIVLQALLLTFGICFALLAVYTLRILRPSENFKLIVASATGGIALYYLISLGLSFFGIRAPLIHDNSLLGIGFTLFVVVIAALNLVVDFDFIEKGVQSRAPKFMEWYGAFALMVTLIWLYMEILRLLSKLRSRR